ncbi:Reticulon-domain-containing protein [Fusarium acuminatum]|uniref:Reticulon-domain-containing protein n=1 Tax=Fusarium acuminatum TaxID=5515 RepID=A0ABZ2WZD9_9HYPO
MDGLRTNNFQPVMADDTAHSQFNPERRRSGPLKEIIGMKPIANIWEDPARTIGSYFAALGFLLAVHHLHLTQYALKTSAIGLGVMSLAEFAGRSFGPDNFVSRLRPRQYKTVPESTLNATLKDIHDFTQYAVVQIQRILLAEDLEKTFGAFLLTTSLYFLCQFMTPFGITILGLTTIYIIPLVTSPRGRGIARDGVARAQEISSAAVDQASTIAQNSKATASNLAAQAQDAASNLSTNAQDTASNLTSRAQDTASNLTSRAQDTAGDLRRRAVNMVPGNNQSNTETRPEHVSDVTSSVPHSSSGPTQAKDVSSKFPQSDMSFAESKDMAAKASHGSSDNYQTLPKTSFNLDIQSSSSGFSQAAVEPLPSHSHNTFSHGTSDNFSSVPSVPSTEQQNMPDFSQNRKPLNYTQFPHASSGTSGIPGTQVSGGKKPSIDETNYSLQNRMDQDSSYQNFVPREAANRGNFSTGADTSMGKMPLGELIDEKQKAGDKAPPISGGGLNAMN